MTDQAGKPPQEEPQQVRSSHIGALVPAHVARGIFSTGVAVLQGTHEFIVDFLLQMQQPQQVAARVILPPVVVGQFLQALGENITKYENRFGEIVLPTVHAEAGPTAFEQPGTTNVPTISAEASVGSGIDVPENLRHSAEDLYDQLRLPEEVMSGQYANAVMIGHTASEFSFDFIATFYPRSVVVQRVFLATPNIPRLKDSLAQSFEQYRRRTGNASQSDSGSSQPENN